MLKLTVGHQKTLICLLLVSATLLVYWQVSGHGFVNLDDGDYVFENQNVTTGITDKNVIWALTESHSANWHPLTWLSHMLDVEWYGLYPGGHHWTSLQIHMANGILLLLVLHSMTGALWPSAFVALLFLLHPLHVESVAWVAERKDVLSTFFWLLSMWAYTRYVRNKSRADYAILLFSFGLGLMAKPMLVTLPFALLLIDYWPLARLRKAPDGQRPAWRRCIAEKTPLFLLSAASCLITFHVQRSAGAVLSHEAIPFAARLGNALVAYIDYMVKTIWPVRLAVFYPHPGSIPAGRVVLSCTILAALSLLFVHYRRRFPFLIVGWLWFLGTLVPVIGLVQVGLQKMADRYTYVPLTGLFMILAWGIFTLAARSNRRRIILGGVTSTVLPVLMACTWLQVGIWKDSMSLFTHALDVTRRNFMAHYAIGRPLMHLGKIDEAIDHYVLSLQIRPDFKETHNGLGIALTRKGDLAGAIHHHKTALRIDPAFAKPHYNLARIYDRQDQPAEAVHHYEEALQIEPEMTIALYNLSWLLATDPDQGIRDGPRALELARELYDLTRSGEALALDALAAAYAETGRFDEAIETIGEGIRLATKSGPPELLGGMHERMGLYLEGKPYRREAKGKEPRAEPQRGISHRPTRTDTDGGSIEQRARD